MQTSMTDPAAAPPAPTAGGCPWSSSAPRLLPLARVISRTLPSLWVATPGETAAEAAARMDAAADITDDLLEEAAVELDTGVWGWGAAA